MKRNGLILFAVIIIFGLLMSGCDILPITVRGGGWLPYYGMQENTEDLSEPVGKTTFGFTVKCYNVSEDNGVWSYDVKGHFQYVDHNNRIVISGKVTGAEKMDGGGTFRGEYLADGETGIFHVAVNDGGEPGANDYFIIAIEGGPYDGYVNEGFLSGGNVQVFPANPVQ